MKCTYFVSFAHEDGFGNIEMTVNGKIKSFSHVETMTKIIKRNNADLRDVVILNFILLDQVDDKEKSEYSR